MQIRPVYLGHFFSSQGSRSHFRLSLLCLCLLFPGSLFAQKGKTRILLAGFNSGGSLFHYAGVYPTYQKFWSFGYEIEPYVGVFLNQSWVVGASGTYGALHSNFQSWEPNYDIGYWARYYPDLSRFRKDRPGRPAGKKRHLLFAHLGHAFGNSYVDRDSGQQVVSAGPSIQRILPGIGADLQVGGNLYVEMAYRPQFYLNAPARPIWQSVTLGLNYLLDPVERGRVKQITMGRRHSRKLRFEAARDSTHHFKPFNRLVLGTNLTYIWDVARLNGAQIEGTTFHELSWHLNIATPILRRLYLGFDYNQIFARDPFSGGNRFRMAGPFAQFDLTRKRKPRRIKQIERFFIELGGYKGDYCTCDPDNPYREENLTYISFGFGLDIKLNQQLHLDLGFNNYEILTDILGKYNYTQYVIGLDFHLYNWKRGD